MKIRDLIRERMLEKKKFRKKETGFTAGETGHREGWGV